MGFKEADRKRRAQRKSRKIEETKTRSTRWLIVCEGTKTEVNYFKQLAQHLNEKYNGNLKIKVEGIGKNTNSLVESVEDYFNYVQKAEGRSKIPYEKVCVVFDKDSFSKQQFNSAIQTAKSKGYIVAWSNECFELWLLLHFELVVSAMGREKCEDKLKAIFKKHGITGGYEKESEKIFEIVNKYGSMEDAIRNAKKIDKGGSNYADHNPSTRVYEIVEKLIEEVK